MAITKEFREFFLRHNVVTSGSKADQEAAFSTKYYVGSSLVYNRFLADDYPSKSVFEKLFESITFKLNPEDTASESQQGLVELATDAESIARSDASSSFQRVVRPSQLPNLVATGSGTVTATVDNNGIRQTENTITTSGRTKKSFSITALYTKSIEVDGSKNLQLVNDSATPGNYYWYGTNGSGTKGYFDLTSYINSLITSAISTLAAVTYTAKSVRKVSNNIELENDAASPGNSMVYSTNGSGTRGWFSISSLVSSLITAAMPSGTIVMFNSATPPSGFALCDGTNGTPDLRGRFIVATGQNQTPAASDLNPTYALGDKGGETTHQLTIAEMPTHKHDVDLSNEDNLATGNGSTYDFGDGSAGTFTFTTVGWTEQNKGGDARHENRPPYYALTFIMKL